MKNSEIRRRSRRYPLQWKAAVVFDTLQGRPVVHTLTQDLSVIGAAIVSDHADLTGAIVTLLLAHPARKASETPTVLKVRARVVSTVRAPGMKHYRHGLSFLPSPRDGLDSLEAMLQGMAVGAPQGGAQSAKVSVAVPPGGRLQQLRQLAQTKQTEGRTADPQEAINASVSDALARAYAYLKDVVEQLNVICPAYAKGYAIPGVPEFGGLQWKEGLADFHLREVSEAHKLFDRVSLRFRLSGDKPVRVAREYPASEKLKQFLEDCQIEFTTQDSWNARGSLERSIFNFPCEVKASVLLYGQFDTGKLLLRARNVAGFGTMEQLLAPEAVSEESLDELTAFILGESPRLGPLLLRNA